MPILFDETLRAVNQSVTSAALVTSGQIVTSGVGIARVNPAAAVTAVTMQPGTSLGQQVTVVNEAVAANTVTMDVVANSNVADGATTVIPGLRASTFTWAGSPARWYRAA